MKTKLVKENLDEMVNFSLKNREEDIFQFVEKHIGVGMESEIRSVLDGEYDDWDEEKQNFIPGGVRDQLLSVKNEEELFDFLNKHFERI